MSSEIVQVTAYASQSFSVSCPKSSKTQHHSKSNWTTFTTEHNQLIKTHSSAYPDAATSDVLSRHVQVSKTFMRQQFHNLFHVGCHLTTNMKDMTWHWQDKIAATAWPSVILFSSCMFASCPPKWGNLMLGLVPWNGMSIAVENRWISSERCKNRIAILLSWKIYKRNRIWGWAHLKRGLKGGLKDG